MFYVLKFEDDYVRFNHLGGGSVQLTRNVGQANQFNSKDLAMQAHQAIFTNVGNYMIENPAMKAKSVYIPKVTFKIKKKKNWIN